MSLTRESLQNLPAELLKRGIRPDGEAWGAIHRANANVWVAWPAEGDVTLVLPELVGGPEVQRLRAEGFAARLDLHQAQRESLMVAMDRYEEAYRLAAETISAYTVPDQASVAALGELRWTEAYRGVIRGSLVDRVAVLDDAQLSYVQRGFEEATELAKGIGAHHPPTEEQLSCLGDLVGNIGAFAYDSSAPTTSWSGPSGARVPVREVHCRVFRTGEQDLAETRQLSGWHVFCTSKRRWCDQRTKGCRPLGRSSRATGTLSAGDWVFWAVPRPDQQPRDEDLTQCTVEPGRAGDPHQDIDVYVSPPA